VSSPTTIGRYALYGAIAAGGMATVYLARLRGPGGFARTVAIKRPRPYLLREDDSIAHMLIDEARLTARIQHPNVVSTLDIINHDDEVLLVMDYVHGQSLSKLCDAARARKERVPVGIAAAILIDTLHGLHAAHDATDENGLPLELVHRDVSPHNILVGADGMTRVADFGIAKALGRAQVTLNRTVKGKLTYMSPEQMQGQTVTRSADIFAASIVFWETLTGRRLIKGDTYAQVLQRMHALEVPALSHFVPDAPAELDAIIQRGLSPNPADRYPTARDMALAIERCVPAMHASEVGAWVEHIAGDTLRARTEMLLSPERASLSFFDSTPASGTRVRPEHLDALTETVPLPLPLPPNDIEGAAAAPAVVISTSEERETRLLQVSPTARHSFVQSTVQSTHLKPKTMYHTLFGICLWLLGVVTLGALLSMPFESPKRLQHAHLSGINANAGVNSALPASSVSLSDTTLETDATSNSTPRAATEQVDRPVQTAKASETKPRRAKKSSACSPPYRIDSKGIRIIKSWCL
jgi:serine/threonine protein kinase